MIVLVVGPTLPNPSFSILLILHLLEKANDFEFWYLYINKHIYSQLYYSCTCNNNTLVDKLFSDDQKHESDNNVDNISIQCGLLVGHVRIHGNGSCAI